MADKYVICGSCGMHLRDTPEQNADHEERRHDAGYGECADCVDFGFDIVFKPLFETVRELLNKKTQAKWDAMSDTRKADTISRLLDKGVLKWKIGG